MLRLDSPSLQCFRKAKDEVAHQVIFLGLYSWDNSERMLASGRVEFLTLLLGNLVLTLLISFSFHLN